MSAHRLLLACAIVAAVALPAAAQSKDRGVSILVYDYASLGRTERDAALDAARAIVAESGVNSDWYDCDSQASCAPGPQGLVVRIIRETTTTPIPADGKRALAYSVVDTTTASGKLATIFVNRVEYSARSAGADVSTLLGRTIAHEIEHLMRGTKHDDEGLMRAVWTERDISRGSEKDFRLKPGR